MRQRPSLARAHAAMKTVAFGRFVAVHEVDTIGIHRRTACRCHEWNAFYTLRRCPALVRVFCDINIPTPVKTKGVVISREGPPGLYLVWPCITDQSGSKDLRRGSGRGLSKIRPHSKRLSEHRDRNYCQKSHKPNHFFLCLLHNKSPFTKSRTGF